MRYLSFLLSCSILLHCGSDPALKRATHPDNVERHWIREAPPTAEISTPGDSPHPECQWIDGQWQWRGFNWAWVKGFWGKAETDCLYATPVYGWAEHEGQLSAYVIYGAWYNVAEEKICQDPEPCQIPVAPTTKTAN